MQHYLILEDEDQYFDQVYEPARRDSEITDAPFRFTRAKTVDVAYDELRKHRFSGAILDLNLAGDGAEGNEVAKKIHSDYLLPIAVVTGFPNELDPDLKDLATKVGFFRLFNKSGDTSDVFNFLNSRAKSGVLDMLGPGGEFTSMISEIFWNHLGEVIKSWHDKPMEIQDKRRVLRHAVSHMIGALLSKEDGDWDKFLPEEVYIWPAICSKEVPGHIYEGSPGDGIDNGFFLLVTPFCDIASAKMEYRHFVRILPFNKFPVNKLESKVEKKDYRYHVLPPTPFFNGGVADFATLLTLPASITTTRLTCKGSLIEPYWRELVNRLGVWMTRQGTPEFDKAELLTEIRKQFVPTALATTTTK